MRGAGALRGNGGRACARAGLERGRARKCSLCGGRGPRRAGAAPCQARSDERQQVQHDVAAPTPAIPPASRGKRGNGECWRQWSTHGRPKDSSGCSRRRTWGNTPRTACQTASGSGSPPAPAPVVRNADILATFFARSAWSGSPSVPGISSTVGLIDIDIVLSEVTRVSAHVRGTALHCASVLGSCCTARYGMKRSKAPVEDALVNPHSGMLRGAGKLIPCCVMCHGEAEARAEATVEARWTAPLVRTTMLGVCWQVDALVESEAEAQPAGRACLQQ